MPAGRSEGGLETAVSSLAWSIEARSKSRFGNIGKKAAPTTEYLVFGEGAAPQYFAACRRPKRTILWSAALRPLRLRSAFALPDSVAFPSRESVGKTLRAAKWVLMHLRTGQLTFGTGLLG